MSWTDDRIAILKKRWADGHSASEIMRELNALRGSHRVLSRSAVIGKIHRLGLSGRDKAPGARAHSKRNAKKADTPWRNGRKPKPRPSLARVTETNIDTYHNPKHDVARKTLAELAETDCRWPVGDPRDSDFGFCAREREPGFSYCAHHVMRAHEQPKIKTPRTGATVEASKPMGQKKEYETAD